MVTTGWRPFEWFLLRGTGFPFDGLGELSAQPVWTCEDGGASRLPEARERLWDWARQPRVREAIARSSPAVEALLDRWYARVRDGRRNSEDRKRERVLWRFLQRLTAKNDSTSFFGPVAAGRSDLVRDPTEPLAVQAGAPSSYVTQWVAQALLDAAGAELGVSFGLLPTGLIAPAAHARELLEQVAPNPADTARDKWLSRTDRLAATAAVWSATPGPGRDALVSELETELDLTLRRRGGEYYASRGPFHEQAERTGEAIGLGPDWLEGMTAALSPYAQLCQRATLAERWTMRGWVNQRFPQARDSPVSWREVLAARKADGPRYQLAAPPEGRALKRQVRELREAMRAAVDDHLEQHGPQVPLRLDPADFERPAAPPLGRPYANPDLLPRADSQGRLRDVVLGEAHYLPMLTGNLLPSLALADEVVEDTRRWLAALCAPGRPTLPWFEQHSFVSTAPDVGATALEISGHADRPPERRVAFDDLAIRLDEAGNIRFEGDLVPLSRTALLDRVSPVYAVELFDLGSWLAAPGWRRLQELPRLSFGDLIVHRRTWVAEELSTLEDARALGLPRFTFMRADGEPKPILVDWADPIAAELAAWTHRRHGPITLTEMLPEPEDLWLRSPLGHHTVELRMVWVGPDLL